MNNIKIIFLVIFTLIIGALNAQNINGVINTYARVTSISGNTFSIDNLSGAISDLAAGQKVLIIQMKGATIERANTIDYGTLLSLNDAGNHEYAIVNSIAGYGPTYTLTVHNLLKTYDANSFVQIISVPQYDNVTVNGELTAAPWRRTTGTGGVLVLEVAGILNLAANIDVSGKGFAGGNVNPTQFGGSTDATNFVTTSNQISGQKGEGIAIYGSEGQYAMGPLANGGGGGNSHNAGGGGGGNFSAGGLGGESHYGPGGNGMGGKQIITNPSLNKLFMGGGGGGGQENNSNASPGGAGGGLILIRANQITSDCMGVRGLRANGANASNTTGNDGAGGGGAGGTILLDVSIFNLTCNIDILTNGGTGGSVTISQKHAGGGGGGAGAILLPGSTANAFTNIGSLPGASGIDCTTCGTTGSPGEVCSGDACAGDGSWPDLPNSSPIAVDDNILTPKNTDVSIEVLINDREADFGDVISVSSIITPPSNGSLTPMGDTFTYTPNPNFSGTDFFTYEICDNGSPALCSSATVTMTVNSILLNDVEANPLSFTEGQTALEITSSTTISHISGLPLESAEIKILTNYLSTEDLLEFTNTAIITGSWDASTGVLTLAGSASLAEYQTALQSIKYNNTNIDDPSDLVRVVSMQVYDGADYSNIIKRSISVIPVNDAPVLSTLESTALTITEGDAAKVLTADIIIADADNTNISSAVVQITTNYLNTEDVLAITNANGITGSWNSATGVLSLSGSASLANYQTALRSVTYRNTNINNPSTLTRTVSFTINDGNLDSNTPSRNIVITPVNDAPLLAAIEAGDLSYTEGDVGKLITATIAATDVDNANLSSAVVQITANYIATEDILGFTDQNGITGIWDVSTGTLSLTGNATKASYQTALRSITYLNSNNANPSIATRTISFNTNDGAQSSNSVSRNITIAAVNDAPALASIETTALAFTEGDAAKIITAAITAADGDNTNLSGALVQITANYSASEDILGFTDQNGITGGWDDVTGTLTLTGNATVAFYQTALQSVTYLNSNNNDPSTATRTVAFEVNDGALSSSVTSRNIEITSVNDAPVLAAVEADDLAYTEGDVAKNITASLTVSDVDNANLSGAVVQIAANYVATEDILGFTDQNGITGSWDASNGTLTLTGNATKAFYQSALRSVTYLNSNNSNPSTATRTATFQVNDGTSASSSVSRSITVTAVNDAPALAAIETTALAFNEGEAAKVITSTLIPSDVDHTNLSGAEIVISANYLSTEDVLTFNDANGITGSWDASTGTLSLSGVTTTANYQTALRSIAYRNTNVNNPSGATRTVSFIVSDGFLTSNLDARDIDVLPVNDAPILAAIEPLALSFTEGDAATALTATMTLGDTDNNNISGASIIITANYVSTEDVLAFTNANGITGSWNATTGTLTLSGAATIAHYQAALRSITYQNTNGNNPSGNTRTASFTINDGQLDSNILTRDISVLPVNDAPILAAIETPALSFTEGDAAKAISASITVNDVDNINIAGASLEISSNYLSTEDVLAFTNATGIAGNWDAATGVLTLSGNATLAQYQAAIRSITYQNTNVDDPSGATRTVSVTINDGNLNSNVLTRDISVIPVNDAPQIANLETFAISFTEGDAATFLTENITNSDVDNVDLTSAEIQITANYLATEDVLAFTDANGISGSWDAASGKLILTGAATIEQYQTDLRAVTYQNINDEKPSVLTRTISLAVSDGALKSNVLTREIEIIPINDAPVTDDDIAVTDKNVPVVINVLENDFDVEGDALSVTEFVLTIPSNGTLELNTDNTFTYTPDFNFFGTDLFEYQVCDDGDPAACASALVSITINYKNYSPVAEDDLIDVLEDETIIIDVLANDSDPDLDEINVSATIVSAPKYGKVVLEGNKYTYTPNLNYNGSDSFEYEICDNGTPSICTTALVDIYIDPVNDAPEPVDDEYRNKDVIAEIKGNVLDNDYDIEADMLSVDVSTLVLPEHGQLTMKIDGTFSYIPNPGFFGQDTFQYFACDDGTTTLCTQATVVLRVSSGVPKGFSPNGDNTNDEWIISGLEEFPTNTVVVLNRYGDIVYEIKGYDNSSRVWRGEVNRGIKLGSGDLPDGTYFYVIDFGDGQSTEKGFVMIKR